MKKRPESDSRIDRLETLADTIGVFLEWSRRTRSREGSEAPPKDLIDWLEMMEARRSRGGP